MIGQSRNNRRKHGADGNSVRSQRLNGAQASFGRRGSRLHNFSEFSIQSGEGNEDDDSGIVGQPLQQVYISSHEFVFGDNADRVAKVGQHFQATASDAKPPFNGLVGIGDAAHGKGLGLPTFCGEFPAENVGRLVFDKDDAFKIQAGRESEELVRWPRIAVDASVFATSIRIDSGAKADVRAVVVGNERCRMVFEVSGLDGRILFWIPISRFWFQADWLEAIGRIFASSSTLALQIQWIFMRKRREERLFGVKRNGIWADAALDGDSPAIWTATAKAP